MALRQFELIKTELEHLLRQKGASRDMNLQALKKVVDEAIPIDGQNVFEFLLSGDRNPDSVLEIPCAAPPFVTSFVEYVVHGSGPDLRAGWFVGATQWEDRKTLPWKFVGKPVSTPHWVLSGVLILDGILDITFIGQVFLDAHGRVIKVRTEEGNEVPYLVYSKNPRVNQTEVLSGREVFRAMSFMFMAVIWTYGFMNIKNVSVETLVIPDKLRKKHEKRLGRKMAEYRVVKIRPTGQRGIPQSGGGKHQAPTLHICRGHFKTFTPEAPLLGRATGTFWWSAQVRGGRGDETKPVDKHYEVFTSG